MFFFFQLTAHSCVEELCKVIWLYKESPLVWLTTYETISWLSVGGLYFREAVDFGCMWNSVTFLCFNLPLVSFRERSVYFLVLLSEAVDHLFSSWICLCLMLKMYRVNNEIYNSILKKPSILDLLVENIGILIIKLSWGPREWNHDVAGWNLWWLPSYFLWLHAKAH